MPRLARRRRLLTPMKKKTGKIISIQVESTPRGRLKDALLDALDPTTEDSDVSLDKTPTRKEKESYEYKRQRRYSSDDDRSLRRQSPQRQSYVLKLFDRSVDLSQFEEDSPLYPICRAWIANQPKADYRTFGKDKHTNEEKEDSVELPGPEGPPISKIPELLPEQAARSKDNINLDYSEGSLPGREQLLGMHLSRWAAVRASWLQQAARAESRYHATHQVLNRINVNNV